MSLTTDCVHVPAKPPYARARPDIFDLKISRPAHLYEAVVEVNERVRVVVEGVGSGGGGGEAEKHGVNTDDISSAVTTVGVTGEEIVVERPVDLESLRPRQGGSSASHTPKFFPIPRPAR